MKKMVTVGAATMLSMAFLIGVNDAQEKKAKYTNAEVMQKAMKGGLCAKVASGKATDAEKEQLIAYFVALHDNTPKKGGADSWKAKTEALLNASKAGDGKALQAAANCKGCHEIHK